MTSTRQPTHIERRGGLTKREQIWAIVRRSRSFTVNAILEQMPGQIDRSTIQKYIKGLEKAGYIERAGIVDGTAREIIFRLINDCGIEAPKVRKDGSLVTSGIGRENMWRALPILGQFTAQDIAMAASTEQHIIQHNEAVHYLRALHKAGYLSIARKANTRQKQSCLYRFIAAKNTGPKPPIVQNVQTVYDPNLGKIMYQAEVNRELD